MNGRDDLQQLHSDGAEATSSQSRETAGAFRCAVHALARNSCTVIVNAQTTVTGICPVWQQEHLANYEGSRSNERKRLDKAGVKLAAATPACISIVAMHLQSGRSRELVAGT